MVRVYEVCDTCKGNHYEQLEHHTVLCRTCKGKEEIIKQYNNLDSFDSNWSASFKEDTDHWTKEEYYEKT